jgi:mannose-6-phosphate isomerase-like protein (cupin superfamily)
MDEGAETVIRAGSIVADPPGSGFERAFIGVNRRLLSAWRSWGLGGSLVPPGYSESGRGTMSQRKSVVTIKEAASGPLPVPGGGGTYRILIDEPTCGARSFSLLVNEMGPGRAGRPHAHAAEHGFYIMSGRGTVTLGDEVHAVGPGTAIFVPAHVPHTMACTGDEPLHYVVIYAPGGTEQELKARGAAAYGR